MRASKETAEKAIQTLAKFHIKMKAMRDPSKRTAANSAVATRYRNELNNFLKAAKSRLPYEASYVKDATRKRVKAK